MRILVTGASGALGAYVLEELVKQGHRPIAWSGQATGERAGIPLKPIDLAKGAETKRSLDSAHPDVVLHLAAISSAAEVLRDPRRAEAINIRATREFSDWCTTHHARLIFTSTDLVFPGEKSWNREEDQSGSRVLYGRMKEEAERALRSAPRGLIARMPLMYGLSRCGRLGFFDAAIADIRAGTPRTFFEDEFRTPLDFATAASILVKLITVEIEGVLHIAGAERMSRFDMMRRIVEAMGLDASLVKANRQADAPGPEPRPADVSLATDKLQSLFPEITRPTLEEVTRSWR